MEVFERFLDGCKHPMVYNGDICELKIENGKLILFADTVEVVGLKGVMIGRGLLARPWMLSDKVPHEVIKQMHERIYRHAEENLCGDSQILSRLHAFWEYLDIDRKAKKAIMKATTLRRYDEAVAIAFRSLVSL